MKTKYFILLITVIFMCSCTEKVEIELNDDANSRIVIDGYITTETKAHQIVITRTSSYFANESVPRESNAEVSITDGNTTWYLLEEEPGVYKTAPNIAGEVGKTYTLKVITSDGDEYTATSTLDTVPEIDNIVSNHNIDPFDGLGYYVLRMFVQEPEGKGDHYMFNVYMDGVLDNDTLYETTFQNDELFDGVYLPGIEIYWIEEEKIINETCHIRLDMLSIPKDYYDYLLAFMQETLYSGGMFSGPPANIPTNISNGGLGYFFAADISTYELEIEKK